MAATLYRGRHALKNRERLNRLLMLSQLCVTGDDDARVYAGPCRTPRSAARSTSSIPSIKHPPFSYAANIINPADAVLEAPTPVAA
jgi:hypothetical protein